MKLAGYNSKEHIYIDANIFIYVIMDNPERADPCDEFLKRVEVGAISGVISPLIVDEVTFKITNDPDFESAEGIKVWKP